ncbi:hypothetical protein A9Q98_15070 [Thalassotalea sp. 42_200_T64]|nr:hypothetical protein A9Q98_15070 [Thalassotalea sp. 42_200_T64]
MAKYKDQAEFGLKVLELRKNEKAKLKIAEQGLKIKCGNNHSIFRSILSMEWLSISDQEDADFSVSNTKLVYSYLAV